MGVALVEVLLGLYLLEKGVDGLFLGITNKAAGVDDDDVAVVLGAIEIDKMACLEEMSSKVLGIDGVFATPEGYDIYFQW